MIFRREIVSLIFLLTISFYAYSQGNVMEYLDPNYQNASLLYVKAPLDDSPFLTTEYLKGNIKMKDGKMLKDIDVKLDINQQLLLIKTGEDMGIVNAKLVDSFEVMLPGETSKSIFIAKSFEDNLHFYQLLYDGDIKLLRKFEKRRRTKEQYTSTGYNTDGPKPPTFIKSEVYYLLISDQVNQIRLSKKSILSTLNNPKYEACAKALDLRLNKIVDLSILLKDCK